MFSNAAAFPYWFFMKMSFKAAASLRNVFRQQFWDEFHVWMHRVGSFPQVQANCFDIARSLPQRMQKHLSCASNVPSKENISSVAVGKLQLFINSSDKRTRYG
ncbi:unnamed protein product [Enterobius vermicularis]|uniref:Secreted protein n=1 Tax=Enterobius vermicularis TaxID=51028 RepID=A0A0N4VL96_ENTVE|nr:unnamed protein product [Enterobius vermicularis]